MLGWSVRRYTTVKCAKSVLFNKRLGYEAHIYPTTGRLQHLLPVGTSAASHPFCLSLLDSLPADGAVDRPTHPAAIFAWATSDDAQSLFCGSLDQPAFLDFMQNCIRQSRAELEYLLRSRARLQGDGWLHLVDERAPIAFGRAPDSDDIIGMCRVQDGCVLPETYEAMPSYRLISRLGIFSLPKPLFQILVQRLRDACHSH